LHTITARYDTDIDIYIKENQRYKFVTLKNFAANVDVSWTKAPM